MPSENSFNLYYLRECKKEDGWLAETLIFNYPCYSQGDLK